MRVYVVGQVSSHDDLNVPAFEEARKALMIAGYSPLIPHDFVPCDSDWRQAMRRSLETLAKADGLACLDGWSKSNGARIEVEIAQRIGLPTLRVEDWNDPQITRKIIELTSTTKVCPRCRRVIPILLFDKSASSPDGRQSYCKSCMTGYKQEHRNSIESD